MESIASNMVLHEMLLHLNSYVSGDYRMVVSMFFFLNIPSM